MNTHSAVVLAAGSSTRMKSQTPKVLHRICGVAMVRLVVDSAANAGLNPIVVVVPQDSQAIKETLGNRVKYVVQTEPLGSGHALLQARPRLRGVDNVVALYGDVPLVPEAIIRKMVCVHRERKATLTLLTSRDTKPDGLGRVVRSADGAITGVVEESEADPATLATTETNSGLYCFRGSWLWENLSSLAPSTRGEIFLTDLVGLAHKQDQVIESVQSVDPNETLGVNTRLELARVEAVLRQRIRERWMLQGVTMPDPSTVYIDATAEIGQDTVILPNSRVTGSSHIAENCEIGPNSTISDSILGNGCKIVASMVEGSTLEESVDVGPFSNIRPGSHLGREVHIGNFSEVKASRLGAGTKSGHFSYIGDAHLGDDVNIGAGTVTCNYDGEKKNSTIIGDGAFIGSGSMLVAPVKIGARSTTGAGSVVTKDVAPDTVVAGVPARELSKKKVSDK